MGGAFVGWGVGNEEGAVKKPLAACSESSINNRKRILDDSGVDRLSAQMERPPMLKLYPIFF